MGQFQALEHMQGNGAGAAANIECHLALHVQALQHAVDLLGAAG
jgi:hypothetical protein